MGTMAQPVKADPGILFSPLSLLLESFFTRNPLEICIFNSFFLIHPLPIWLSGDSHLHAWSRGAEKHLKSRN